MAGRSSSLLAGRLSSALAGVTFRLCYVVATHTVLSFRDRSFVPGDCFRQTVLHSSFARIFGEEVLVD